MTFTLRLLTLGSQAPYHYRTNRECMMLVSSAEAAGVVEGEESPLPPCHP